MSRPSRSQPSAPEEAHIRCDKKGRGGKTVTVVYNLRLSPDRLKELGKHRRSSVVWHGKGASRFDGKTWATYRSHNNVYAIALAPDGAVWLGTDRGASRYLPPR